jgi:hypothetical protein
MTFNDLEQIFVDGCYRSILTNHEDLPEKAHRRAGLKAVVEALRDEFWMQYGLRAGFDEILASDGDGKAAGGSSGERVAPEGVTPTSSTPAAAPDVCEWTPKRAGSDMHHTACEKIIWRCDEHAGICPSCGKPISFKEGSE